MEIYKINLKDFVQIHSNLYEIYTKQLAALPDGRLIGRKYKTKHQYYQLQSFGGKCIRKGIGKNEQLKRQLARKEYLTKVLPILERNIKTLESASNRYAAIRPAEIIDKMSDVYKSLPKKYFIDKLDPVGLISTDNVALLDPTILEELQQWMDAPFDQSTYKPEEKIHTTSRDLKVRTKSELIIAEILYMYNIAFRYEQRVYIKSRRFAPDFTIKLPDGSIFYWEHVGLTNNKWYMHDHYDKLKHYQYKDIVPWKNLILTYDNELGDLNTQIIHSEIKNKLLNHF